MVKSHIDVPLFYLNVCVSVYLIPVLPQIIAFFCHTLHCRHVFYVCPLELLQGRPQALPASPAFAGRGQLSCCFLLALTQFPWLLIFFVACSLFSNLMSCYWFVVVLTPSTLLSLESVGGDRGKRKWGWAGEGLLGGKGSTGA